MVHHSERSKRNESINIRRIKMRTPFKKTKSRFKKAKILQDKHKRQKRTRVNTFTDSFDGVEHYKSKRLDRSKGKDN